MGGFVFLSSAFTRLTVGRDFGGEVGKSIWFRNWVVTGSQRAVGTGCAMRAAGEQELHRRYGFDELSDAMELCFAAPLSPWHAWIGRKGEF